jgi:hypothetical protein
MGRIRSLAPEDAPHVAALHKRVGLSRPSTPLEALVAHFRQTFVEHPWGDAGVPSLVYEEANGEIAGFLGALPLPLTLEGRHLTGAFCSNFMVREESRSSLAALALMRTFFSGPQDLSLAEGGRLPRAVWEGVGGSTSLLNSLQWRRPLRPARYLLYRRERRAGGATLARALAPLARSLDFLASRPRRSPFALPRPDLDAEDLSVETHLECLETIPRRRVLCPRYDRSTLRWTLDRLARQRGRGEIRRLALRKRGGELAGWYLYYLPPGGMAQVIQMGAQDDAVDGVIDHLFHDAWAQGAVGIGGRLQPVYMENLVRKCRLLHFDEWVFVHSRDRDLLNVFHRGDAFLTHLEGEYWMTYRGDPVPEERA